MVDDLVIPKKSGGLTMIDKINTHNVNVFVGKLGDILYKVVDKPLGMAINWGRLWSLWPVHIETWNLVLHQVQDMMWSGLVL
jgi:hypothetical protein